MDWLVPSGAAAASDGVAMPRCTFSLAWPRRGPRSDPSRPPGCDNGLRLGGGSRPERLRHGSVKVGLERPVGGTRAGRGSSRWASAEVKNGAGSPKKTGAARGQYGGMAGHIQDMIPRSKASRGGEGGQLVVENVAIWLISHAIRLGVAGVPTAAESRKPPPHGLIRAMFTRGRQAAVFFFFRCWLQLTVQRMRECWACMVSCPFPSHRRSLRGAEERERRGLGEHSWARSSPRRGRKCKRCWAHRRCLELVKSTGDGSGGRNRGMDAVEVAARVMGGIRSGINQPSSVVHPAGHSKRPNSRLTRDRPRSTRAGESLATPRGPSVRRPGPSSSH